MINESNREINNQKKKQQKKLREFNIVLKKI